MKNTREFKSVSEIIPEALKKIGAEKNFGKYSTVINWEKIVGKEIANNSFVSSIDRGTLIIKAKNSVWSHHLMMLKAELIKKVNDYFGKKLITDIRFMAGYNKNDQNYEVSEKINDSEKEKLIPLQLDKSEIAAIRNITEKMNDEKVRQKITNIIIKDMSLKKAKKAKDWKSCFKCEILISPEEKYCTVCRISKNKNGSSVQNKIIAVEKILTNFPWLSYIEMKKNFDLSINENEYDTAKKNLIHRYIKLIFKDNKYKIYQSVLVMLLKGIKPENLTKDYIDYVIDEVKEILLKTGRGKYVFASGS